MKKFEQKDIFINTLKTYPKVKIIANNGLAYYNNINLTGPQLSDFLPDSIGIPGNAILLESTEPLITEDGDYIIIE